MLFDFEGASVRSEVAAEVDGITLAKVGVSHPFDVLGVAGPGDVDPAVVDKPLKPILILFTPRLNSRGIGLCHDILWQARGGGVSFSVVAGVAAWLLRGRYDR